MISDSRVTESAEHHAHALYNFCYTHVGFHVVEEPRARSQVQSRTDSTCARDSFYRQFHTRGEWERGGK